MPPDPISRSAAKNPVESLLRAINEEANDAHRKCGNLLTADENFQLGRHGGLMWAYNAVAHAALDSLPAAEADGRWNDAMFEFSERLNALVNEDDAAWEAIDGLDTIEVIESLRRDFLKAWAPSPPAAEGAQRQYDEHGQPICNYCNAKTNRAYAKHVKLQCWKCGNYLPELDSGPAAQLRGEG